MAAKLSGEAKGGSSHKTRTGTPIGTPQYMSPEQCVGEPADERSDVYAFGIVAFELLTGGAPFTGDNMLAIPIAVAIGTPLYVDGYAALPLVRGLIELGMSPGAAMAFLIAGGVTSLYASVAVFALVRWPVFLWYLALAVAGAVAAGYGFQAAMELSG